MLSWEERFAFLGYSKNEAQVFLCLLEGGPSTCGPICQRTGLYRVMVYQVLEKLSRRGLVSYFLRNNRRVFQAENPDKILSELTERQFQASGLVSDLKLLSPRPSASDGVCLYEGIYGIKSAQENYLASMEQKKGEYLMFGASFALHERMDAFFNYFHERRSRLSIPARLLFNENGRPFGRLKKKYAPVQVRYLPQNVITPSWTSIYDDKMLIGVFKEKPVALFIQDPVLVDSYRNYFELLWKQGRP